MWYSDDKSDDKNDKNDLRVMSVYLLIILTP